MEKNKHKLNHETSDMWEILKSEHKQELHEALSHFVDKEQNLEDEIVSDVDEDILD